MAKITINSIKEQAQHMEEVKELELLDKNGETVTIQYYPRFSNKKVGELVTDLLLLVKDVEDNKYGKYTDLSVLDKDLNMIINFLTVKHFTELKAELEGVSYEEQLLLMENLLNIPWFGEILIAFEDGELAKVATAVSNSVAIFNRLDDTRLPTKKATNRGKKK